MEPQATETTPRPDPIARVLAVTALIVAAIVVAVIVSDSVGGSGVGGGGGAGGGRAGDRAGDAHDHGGRMIAERRPQVGHRAPLRSDPRHQEDRTRHQLAKAREVPGLGRAHHRAQT